MLNYYFFYAYIFDTSADADLEVFPQKVPVSGIGETFYEAQRYAVDELYNPQNGYLTKFMRDDDSGTRFNIVFDDDPEFVRPIE